MAYPKFGAGLSRQVMSLNRLLTFFSTTCKYMRRYHRKRTRCTRSCHVLARQSRRLHIHIHMYVCMYGMLGISGESPHYNNAKRSGTVKRPKKKWYFKCLIMPGSAEIKYGKSCWQFNALLSLSLSGFTPIRQPTDGLPGSQAGWYRQYIL